MRVMPEDLRAVLREAQDLGWLGAAPLDRAIAHAEGFAVGVPVPPARFADLGTGGGVPGLVLAFTWPAAEVVLVEGSTRRASFLAGAVVRLGLADRCRVLAERAELTGRREDVRAACDVVVARGFAAPAVTAECAAPLLRVGGVLVVSEPPSGEDRWPADGLGSLGLTPGATWTTDFHYRALHQSYPCPTRYPRRVGIPTKRPLF
jgi:16S rRNA (guanine527-N7)-methyltransferase